jgi:phage-related protein (TIGR01555 family)
MFEFVNKPTFVERVRNLFTGDSDGWGGSSIYETPYYGDPSLLSPGRSTVNQYSAMNTSRDQSAHVFYGYARTVSRWELENAYRSSWIAKRIVNLPPNDMTREWRKFSIEEDDGDQVKQLETTERALQVKKRCNQALRWARLYGGSLMFLGIDNDDTEKPLVFDTVRKDSLKWISVLDRWHVSYQWQGNYIYDVANPQFATPEFYTMLGSGQRWHYSRVIRFDGEELPLDLWLANARWADSALNHVLSTVIGLEAAQRACLLAMQQGSLDMVSLPGMRAMLAMDASGAEQIYNRVRFFSDLKSVYRVAVKDADEKFERIAASLGGYDTLFAKYQDEVCGAAEIPHTVLYGQSPSGFHSTGNFDTRQYYDSISTKQESDLRPQLDYFDQVLVRSSLGTMPDGYSFDFNSLWQIDEEAQATLDLQRAQRDHIYVTDGVLQPEMVTRQLFRDGAYSTLTKEDVDLIESFNQPIEPGEATAPEGEPLDVAAPGVQQQTQPKRSGRQTITISTTAPSGSASLAP